MKSLAERDPVTSGAAFVWLVSVAFVLNSASNHRVLVVVFVMVSWTVCVSGGRVPVSPLGLNPEMVPWSLREAAP